MVKLRVCTNDGNGDGDGGSGNGKDNFTEDVGSAG